MSRNRPPLNIRERYLRERLCEQQQWRCYWCGGFMKPAEFKGGPTPADAPVLCRLDARYTFERGLHSGELRKVAAHFSCTDRRAKLLEATVPIEELHDRAQGRIERNERE